ncbi:MAG: amidohydrolase family protein [Chloroflexi bacterium]|nr:amidohydrolase family protein [Chloroflexota bacterium]
MITKPRVIDWHGHFLPKRLMDAFLRTRYGQDSAPFWQPPAWSDPEDHIRMMDELGVEAELFGPTNTLLPAVKAAGMGVEEGVRWYNDEMARLAADYPGRFYATVGIDPFDTKFALAEIERCVTQLGMRAVLMATCYDGLYIDDERFWPIFRLAEELDVPIFAHPAAVLPYWKEMQKADRNILRIDVAMLLASTICIGRLIYYGIYDRFPKLNVVFGQLGGFIPFMFGRFDCTYNFWQLWPDDLIEKEAVLPLRYARDYKGRIFGDTHTSDRAALECAVQTLGAECIVVGGDYPLTPVDFGLRWNLAEINSLRITDEERRNILGENAARLLKLDR